MAFMTIATLSQFLKCGDTKNENWWKLTCHFSYMGFSLDHSITSGQKKHNNPVKIKFISLTICESKEL